jgi:hypothetical protein
MTKRQQTLELQDCPVSSNFKVDVHPNGRVVAAGVRLVYHVNDAMDFPRGCMLWQVLRIWLVNTPRSLNRDVDLSEPLHSIEETGIVVCEWMNQAQATCYVKANENVIRLLVDFRRYEQDAESRGQIPRTTASRNQPPVIERE